MTTFDEAVKRVKEAIDGASAGLTPVQYREFLDDIGEEISLRSDAATTEDDDAEFDDEDEDDDSDLDEDLEDDEEE